MKVKFLKKFNKDIDKITTPKDRKAILEIIQMIKDSGSFDQNQGVKKLNGFPDAFRIRSSNYRIDVFVEGDKVLFARVAHR